MHKKYLAFDVGGTSIKYAVIDSNLKMLDSGKTATNHNQDQTIVKALTTISPQLSKITKVPH